MLEVLHFFTAISDPQGIVVGDGERETKVVATTIVIKSII
jgi:hypothetical protein